MPTIFVDFSIALIAMIAGIAIASLPYSKEVINDTLKENGYWSMGRLTILVCFVCNLGFAAYVAWKTNLMPDLPPNWLILICTLWGINKTATAYIATKGVANVPSIDTANDSAKS